MSLRGQVSLKLGEFQLESGEFQLPDTGLTAVFGHSGSGKTTFLRCLAGFEPNAKGEVYFFDQAWLKLGQFLPIHKRQLGYVFQEASLFAHLTVEGNLRYGFKRAKEPRSIEFNQVVDWLGLSALLSRDVLSLSGGEKQRVAIGRTLLSQPKVLMMDEPMASLDVFSKRAIMPYIERLRDELEIPILYITHSPEEVERLADTVVFMSQGCITQIEPIAQALNRVGTPLYQNAEPRSVIAAEVVEQVLEDGLTRLSADGAELFVPALDEPLGAKVRVVIAANQVSLMASQPDMTSVLNHLMVTIESIEPVNEYSLLLRLRSQDAPWPLLAQVTKRSARRLNLQVGQHWVAAIKSASILN